MAPKITLYTAHLCPWAHRSQIALRELGLEFETVIIDLSVPRTPEYLAINPRGLVPALSYDGKILYESGLIAQFLVDAHPSHLAKTSSEPGGALQRFQIGFFVDTYFTKAHPNLQAAVLASGEEKLALAAKYVDAIVKEIEPLLSDAAPFFGGSSRLTLAEVQTASFILRALALSKHEDLLPGSILTTLSEKAPNFWKWAQAVIVEKSVTAIWDEDVAVKSTKARIQRLAAAKAQKVQ